MATATLSLDADSLRLEDLSLPALRRELNLPQRPHWLLRKIMNAREQICESRGRAYHSWKGEEARQWSHGSARSIDSFGPRSFIPVGRSFS